MRLSMKIAVVVAAGIAIGLSSMEANAGGRYRRSNCVPYYAGNAVAAPAAVAEAQPGRVNYRSAYQAPVAAPQQYYQHPGQGPGYRSESNYWDHQRNEARRVKGL